MADSQTCENDKRQGDLDLELAIAGLWISAEAPLYRTAKHRYEVYEESPLTRQCALHSSANALRNGVSLTRMHKYASWTIQRTYRRPLEFYGNVNMYCFQLRVDSFLVFFSSQRIEKHRHQKLMQNFARNNVYIPSPPIWGYIN